MARFTEDVLVVNHLSGRVHQWEMRQPMTYKLVDTEDAQFVTVPPRFTTNFASVPRPFWFWIAPWGRHGRAAIVHDFLYQNGSVTDPRKPKDDRMRMRRPCKAEADRIFRDAIAVLDEVILSKSKLWGRALKPLLPVRLALAAPKRWLMWAAVVVFGHWAYKKEKATNGGPPREHDMLVAVAEMVGEEQGPAGTS
jgi:Protein of unknown function (DUF1353)